MKRCLFAYVFALIFVHCAFVLLLPDTVPRAFAAPGAHGPNGEHLDIPSGTSAAADSMPQFETMSEYLEVTGHLLDSPRALRLYVNHFGNSEPVLDAQTQVEVQLVLPTGDIAAEAPLDEAQGAYTVTDARLLDALRPGGSFPLLMTVMGPDDSDLLEATLVVPDADNASQEGDGQHSASGIVRVPLPVWQGLAALLGLRLLADVWLWGRRRTTTTSTLGAQQ